MELLLPIFLINYTINAGDLDKGNTDGNQSDNSFHTVGYIVSDDDDISDFEPSDNEPFLNMLQRGLSHQNLPTNQVMLLNLGDKEDHMAKQLQRLLNLSLG